MRMASYFFRSRRQPRIQFFQNTPQPVADQRIRPAQAAKRVKRHFVQVRAFGIRSDRGCAPLGLFNLVGDNEPRALSGRFSWLMLVVPFDGPGDLPSRTIATESRTPDAAPAPRPVLAQPNPARRARTIVPEVRPAGSGGRRRFRKSREWFSQVRWQTLAE